MEFGPNIQFQIADSCLEKQQWYKLAHSGTGHIDKPWPIRKSVTKKRISPRAVVHTNLGFSCLVYFYFYQTWIADRTDITVHCQAVQASFPSLQFSHHPHDKVTSFVCFFPEKFHKFSYFSCVFYNFRLNPFDKCTCNLNLV